MRKNEKISNERCCDEYLLFGTRHFIQLAFTQENMKEIDKLRKFFLAD